MQLTIRLLRETDGLWIADIPDLPGVTVYGASAEDATLRAKALALRVIAEEIEHGEMPPGADTLQFLDFPFDLLRPHHAASFTAMPSRADQRSGHRILEL
jgi:predicted RNase H-like HicB family nuclease